MEQVQTSNNQNITSKQYPGNTRNVHGDTVTFANNIKSIDFVTSKSPPRQRQHYLTPSPRNQSRFIVKKQSSQYNNHEFFKNNLGIDSNNLSPLRSNGVESDKVKENLILLAMEQMNEVINEKVTISKVLEQNKLIWMRSMIRNKGIQSIIDSFQIQIKKSINNEFKKNEEKIQRFMNVSRAPDLTIMNSAHFIRSCQGKFSGEESNVKKIKKDQKMLREVMAEKPLRIRTGPAPSNPRYKTVNTRGNNSSRESSQLSSDQNISSGQRSSGNIQNSGSQLDERQQAREQAKFRFKKGMKLLRSFKNPKHSHDLRDSQRRGLTIDPNDPSSKRDINYHQLASQIQTTKDLVSVAKEFFFPADLPENIKPTDQWLQQMANENRALMNSFTFKKKLIAEIHEKIYLEIRRKRTVMEMGDALKKVEDKVNMLNNDACALFHGRDENKLRSKQPPLIKNFQNCYQIEPHKTDMMVKSRAIEYMSKWIDQPIQDHTDTINSWKGIWQVNERFEYDIMNELKGHHLEMRQVQQQWQLKYNTLMSKVDLRLQASERALNEAKLSYHNRLNQLEMIDQDRESEELRSFYKRKEAGSSAACEEKMEFLINSLRPTKYSQLKDAQSMLEKIKLAGRDYIVQQKEQAKLISNLKIDNDNAVSKMRRFEEESNAKSLMFQWVHEIVTFGSMPSAPRAMLNQESKKRLDLFKKESLFKQQIEFMQEQEVLQKFQGEIQMSKIFSIVVYNIFQVFNELSLFQSNEKVIRKNPNKFSLNGNQLFEIWNLFKSEPVQEQMTVLNKNRAEMVKFRIQMGQKDDEDQEEGAAVSPRTKSKNEEADKMKDAYFKRINNEFNNLKEDDFALSKVLVKPMVRSFGLLMMQEDEFLAVSKTDAFVEKLNQLLVEDSQSENEFGAQHIKFHDLIKYDEQNLRVQIDPLKFSIFVKENKENILKADADTGNDEESGFLKHLSMVVDTVKTINNLVSGKSYDKAVGFKPGRRLVEDDPLRGFLFLNAHSDKAPKKEVQCQILDATTMEQKIEKKVQRGFDLKLEKVKSRNQALEEKIAQLREDLKEQEMKLRENGVSFVSKEKSHENIQSKSNLLNSEAGIKEVRQFDDDELTDLYSDIKKMSSVFSGAPNASRILNINDLDNLAVFQQKIHNLDIFKYMTSAEEGQQIPLVTQKTKLIARKSFEKDTIGAVIMQGLTKQIKKTIKKLAQGQDPANMANISPNLPSRHTIKIPNKSAFANTPAGSDYEESSQSASDYSLSSNGEGGSVVRMRNNPKKRKRGEMRNCQAQTELTGEFQGKRTKEKHVISEQFTTGDSGRHDPYRDDSSRPDRTNTDMMIEEQNTQRTLLDDASRTKQNQVSISSDPKHCDQVNVGKWNGTRANSSLSKGFDPSLHEIQNDENLTTEEMKKKCQQLLNSFQMGQILLKDKFQIFPQQKKLKPGQYHNMKGKLDELQKVHETLSARRAHEQNLSEEETHEQMSKTVTSTSPRTQKNNSKVVVQLDESVSQIMKSQNLNPRFNIRTHHRGKRNKLAQSLNITRASKLNQSNFSPSPAQQNQVWAKSYKTNTAEESTRIPQAKADVSCSPMNTSQEYLPSRKVSDIITLKNQTGDKEDSSLDIDDNNPRYLDTIPSLNQDQVGNSSTPAQSSQKRTNEQETQNNGVEHEPKQVNFYQYPAKHSRKFDGSNSKKSQRNEDIKTLNKFGQIRKASRAQKKKSTFSPLSGPDSNLVAQEFIINIEEAQDFTQITTDLLSNQKDKDLHENTSCIQDKAVTEHVDTPVDGIVILPLQKKPSLQKMMEFNPNIKSLTIKLSDDVMSVRDQKKNNVYEYEKAFVSVMPHNLQNDFLQVENRVVTSKLKKSEMSLMSQLSTHAQRQQLRFGNIKQVQTTKNYSRPQFSSQTGPGLTLESNRHENHSRPSEMRKELFRYYEDKSSQFLRNMSPKSDIEGIQMIGSSFQIRQKKKESPINYSPDDPQDRVLYANLNPDHYLSNIAPKTNDFSTIDMNVPPYLLKRDPVKKINKKKSEAFCGQKPLSNKIEFMNQSMKHKYRRNNNFNTLLFNNNKVGMQTHNISRLLGNNTQSRDRQIMSKSTVSSPLSFS